MLEDLQKRKKRNCEIIKRMKQGEALVGNPQATWFPERPSIKKDPKLVAALYCSEGHTFADKKCTVCGLSERTTGLKLLE